MNKPDENKAKRRQDAAQLRADGAYDRQDGFYNLVTGMGNPSMDPTANWKYTPNLILPDGLLESLYMGNDIARRIVDLPADACVKAFCKVLGDDQNLILPAIQELSGEKHLADALRFARLFGGSAIVMICDDGGTLMDELNTSKLQSIVDLRTYDRSQVFWDYSTLDMDPESVTYGEPLLFQIYPYFTTPYYVHRSRLLLFYGNAVTNRMKIKLRHWNIGVLNSMPQVFARYESVLKHTDLLVTRMSQAVLKYKDLAEALGTDEGEAAVKSRLQLLDMMRSMLNMIAIDADGEEFELHNVPLSGIHDIIDRMAIDVSAHAGIPREIIFGQQSGGIHGGAQNGEMMVWMDSIAAYQKQHLLAPLTRLVDLLSMSKKCYGKLIEKRAIEFLPVYPPDQKTAAEANFFNGQAMKQRADASKSYVEIGALTPQEVRNNIKSQQDLDVDGDILTYVAPEIDTTVAPVKPVTPPTTLATPDKKA